ncbi:MAG: hypothetical protein LBB84_10190 [Tannerellaceae bacterium]|nr:hypothetical protein [Tannerellaceae bacterium]
MKLFNFFKNSKNNASELPEIREKDFIDNTEPSEKNIITIRYGTGKPIDIVYSYLEADYDNMGYNDALGCPDNSYKEKSMKSIKSKFEILLNRTISKYEELIRDKNFHIETRERAGLLDIVENLKTQKNTLEDQKGILMKMKNELQDETLSYANHLLISYEKGFTRGLAALSLETFKNQ